MAPPGTAGIPGYKRGVKAGKYLINQGGEVYVPGKDAGHEQP